MNSVGAKLDLSAGKVSHAISKKAGPELQEACNKLAPINIGEVKETLGFDMECRTILHCFCPQPYMGSKTIEVRWMIRGAYSFVYPFAHIFIHYLKGL